MLAAANKIAKEAAKELLKVTVNGRAVAVPLGSTILEAINASNHKVPTLCYHPSFKPKAVCRMCMVNVQGKNKPVASCHTPAEDGMVVTTDDEELREFRKRDLQFLLARHPNNCMRCEASGNCKLQDLVIEYGVEDMWPDHKKERGSPNHPEHFLHDHSSPAIQRDLDKCIECGLCVDACAAQQINAIGFGERGAGMIPVTTYDKPLNESGCINCGQCTLKCPVGAVVEKPDWQRVKDVLNSPRTTVVQTAPATRVALAEEFGFDSGTASTGRMVNALRAVGFDYVMDTDFTADLTIMEEANELLSRLRGERPHAKLPLFTSCCPGWINYIEIYRPDLIPHLSSCKSPQQMFASSAKYGPFAKALDIDEEPFLVSIMPCTAKKDEAVRPGMHGDVDAVLTTRELAKLIKHQGVNFASLPEDGEYDSPLGESTGAAVIFGASGGVLEAALRTAADVLGIKDAPIDWKTVRGVKAPIKEATVPGVGTVAVVNSIGSAVDFLSNDDWKEKYLMVEVMTCPGGCLGGGGQPKSDDPQILEKRMESIYALDENMAVRKSHENKEVQQLYEDWLGEPLSETSEEYLHATYAGRGSPRDKLMRFLDAVDHRDGMVASSLFAEDGVWDTGVDAFGLLRGRDAISKHIKTMLQPLEKLKPGEDRHRHKMLNHAEGTDVLSPKGEKFHFDVELDPASGLIKSVVRKPFVEVDHEEILETGT